jgi:four helix bundle protein
LVICCLTWNLELETWNLRRVGAEPAPIFLHSFPCKSNLHFVAHVSWPSACILFSMGNRAPIKRFEDLIVWQRAMTLSKRVYRVTSTGKFASDWGLRDQVRRASVSILSNIAEGFGKYSNREFKKYLAIANGSSFEVRAQVHLARELGYIDKTEADVVVQMCEEISRLIAALRRSMS